MLKEDTTLSLGWKPETPSADDPYEYVRVRPAPSDAAPRRKAKGLVLPVGMRVIQTVATLPLQSYLQERFDHIGGKSNAARALRAENQRRHDLAASLGHWQMSRTS